MASSVANLQAFENRAEPPLWLGSWPERRRVFRYEASGRNRSDLPILVTPSSLLVDSMLTTRHCLSEERTIHQFARAGLERATRKVLIETHPVHERAGRTQEPARPTFSLHFIAATVPKITGRWRV